MQMAVGLRAISRKAYNLLRNDIRIPLPSSCRPALSSWISRTVCAPGIQMNRPILNFLKNQVEEMCIRDKCCVLCIDEMSVRQYRQKKRPHSFYELDSLLGCKIWRTASKSQKESEAFHQQMVRAHDLKITSVTCSRINLYY